MAGDLAVVGPDPQGVIDTIREEGWIAIEGNTDHDLVEAAEWATDLEELRYWIEHLSDDAIDFLATLPFSHRITPPGAQGPEHDLLVVHANPHLDQLVRRQRAFDLRDDLGGETCVANLHDWLQRMRASMKTCGG